MKKHFEISAWRREEFTISGEFEAETSREALALAKLAFAKQPGENCSLTEGWEEFEVDEIDTPAPADHRLSMLAALKAACEWIDARLGLERQEIQAILRRAIEDAEAHTPSYCAVAAERRQA